MKQGAHLIALMGAAIAASLLLISTAEAEDINVDWPAGWTVSKLPPPSGAQGYRLRAILPGTNNRPLAAIELTVLKRITAGKFDLSGEFYKMQDAMREGFAQRSATIACAAPSQISFGSLDALETTCTGGKDGTNFVKQIIDVGGGPDHVYSLTYSTTPSGFDEHLPTFVKIRTNLPTLK